MHPAVLRRFVFAERRRVLADKIARYAGDLGRSEIEQIQVDRFNTMWTHCLEDVPFYRSWRAEHGLPSRIASPSDLASFPLLEKEVLVARSDEIFQGGRITSAYTTGGSSGRPARYPRAAGDATAFYVNLYLGRSWWGIKPFDPNVMIWGHAHLFGSGFKGQIQQLRRRAADRLINIARMDGYDLTGTGLEADFKALRSKDPVFLIGYTSAIFKLARFMDANGLKLAPDRQLRAVIVTAETVSDADIEAIQRAFGASVVIEYGTAETGVMATSRGGSHPLQVVWDSFVLLTAPDGALSITTLDARLFPLVNYSPGDVLIPGDVRDGNVLTIKRVLGRQQDIVSVATTHGGVLDLSAILPVHILKSYPDVLGVQFRQISPRRLQIFVENAGPISMADVKAFFTREMRKDHPGFDETSVDFEQSTGMVKTCAGKQALFIE